MSKQFSFNIPAHHNIYTGSANRELRIDFSIPEEGVNSDTGLLILVPGFGAHIDSNVYKKMREVFSDDYNLIVIQCDYFGSKHMQSANKITLNNQELVKHFSKDEISAIQRNASQLLNLMKEKNLNLSIKAELDESLEDFNDMSYMQAIDLIIAIEAVKIIIEDNNYSYNPRRTLGYGHSHGAYLLHLCNVLVPNLFSFIIDNSAWLEPVYLHSNRKLCRTVNLLSFFLLRSIYTVIESCTKGLGILLWRLNLII